MKINEIVNPHTPADRTLDSIAGVDTHSIEEIYKIALYLSNNFLISKHDAVSPDRLSEIEDIVNELANFVSMGSTSYKMLQEIRQWLNGE